MQWSKHSHVSFQPTCGSSCSRVKCKCVIIAGLAVSFSVLRSFWMAPTRGTCKMFRLSNETEPVIDSWKGVADVPRKPWVGVTYFSARVEAAR